jgi:hypothetical protein
MKMKSMGAFCWAMMNVFVAAPAGQAPHCRPSVVVEEVVPTLNAVHIALQTCRSNGPNTFGTDPV